MRPGICTALLAAHVSISSIARGESGDGKAGMLVVATASTASGDARLGRLGAALHGLGVESVVGHRFNRPPSDAEKQIVEAQYLVAKGERNLAIGRRNAILESRRLVEGALETFERCASNREHLVLFARALLLRADVSLALGNLATTEASIIRALAVSPDVAATSDRTAALKQIFRQVRRAARELDYGTLRIEAGTSDVKVLVNFGSPASPPLELRLPEGRHFVYAYADGREPTLEMVPVRSKGRTVHAITLPNSKNLETRARALNDFEQKRTRNLRALSVATGHRFLVLADVEESRVGLRLFDGESGAQVGDRPVYLSAQPAPPELTAASRQLFTRAATRDESLNEEVGGPWLGSWWTVAALGLAIAGAATTTVFLLARPEETTYVFR